MPFTANLYLPQAKVYDRSCSLGPGILVSSEPLSTATEIRLEILRAGQDAFSGSTTLRNLKRDPRVSIVVYGCNEPYSDVLAIRGRVEMILEGANEHIDKLSHMYEGKAFAFRPAETRVIVKVTPERIHVQ